MCILGKCSFGTTKNKNVDILFVLEGVLNLDISNFFLLNRYVKVNLFSYNLNILEIKTDLAKAYIE